MEREQGGRLFLCPVRGVAQGGQQAGDDEADAERPLRQADQEVGRRQVLRRYLWLLSSPSLSPFYSTFGIWFLSLALPPPNAAAAGRSTTCTIVPTHHFGPIPGIAVGTVFTSRLHLSEGGVHRPPVSGISGTEKGRVLAYFSRDR